MDTGDSTANFGHRSSPNFTGGENFPEGGNPVVHGGSGVEYIPQGDKLFVGFLRGDGRDKLFYPISVKVAGKDLVKDALQNEDFNRVQKLAERVHQLVRATKLDEPGIHSDGNLSGLTLRANFEETTDAGGLSTQRTVKVNRIDVNIHGKSLPTIDERYNGLLNNIAPHFEKFRLFSLNKPGDEEEGCGGVSVSLGTPMPPHSMGANRTSLVPAEEEAEVVDDDDDDDLESTSGYEEEGPSGPTTSPHRPAADDES